MSSIAVIGTGIGGLSATAHLISQGHDVTVFERESFPGGRAAKKDFETPYGDYLLEYGPAVFTMLDVACRPFEVLDEKLDDHIEILRVDPSYQGKFKDGSIINWPANEDEIFDVISSFVSQHEARGFQQYKKWLEKLVSIEYDRFIARNFYNTTDVFKHPTTLMKLLQMGAFRRMDRLIRRYMVDERLISMCTFQAIYAGVSPQRAIAAYCIVSYMDLIKGVHYPKGGIHKYPYALAQACENAGAKIYYDTNVDRIFSLFDGIEVNAESISEKYDAVVCNADLAYAYPQIFGLPMPRRVAGGDYSPSCMVYVVGGKASSKSGAHHTINFARNAKYGFNDLVKKRQLMQDPSYLVSNPTFTDKSIAPEGSDIFHVLEPVPHLESKVDYQHDKVAHQERLKGLLTKSGVSFDRVDCELFIDPTDWEQQGMYKGTPFSMSHTFFQSGPFRPLNEVRRMPGVFLCGSGTTPGVGIPLVIESGRMAAEKVQRYLQTKQGKNP